MSGDRVKIRELTAEWGAELGVSGIDLARAITEAAIAGEFDHLPPANRASIFDDRRLIHMPIQSGRPAYPERLVLFSIRGMGFIHRDAVEAFASAGGRGYPLPKRWAQKGTASSRTAKPGAVAAALKSLYPDGRGHVARKTMAKAVSEVIGETVSLRSLDRATDLAWPRPPRAK